MMGTVMIASYLYNEFPYAWKDSLYIVMVSQCLQLSPTDRFQDVKKKDINSVQYDSIIWLII